MRWLPLLLTIGCSQYGLENLIDTPDEPEPEEEIVFLGPSLVVYPPIVEFGRIEPGDGIETVITLRNDGDANLLIEDVLPPDAPFTISNLGSTNLTPGRSADVIVSFEPEDLASYVDALLVRSPDVPDREVLLLGGGMPRISVEPAAHDFGEIEVGASSAVPVEVRNIGLQPLTVTGFDYAPSSPDLFLLDPPATPFVLAPGDASSVLIGYEPEEPGRDEAVLRIFSNDIANPEAIAVQQGTGYEAPTSLVRLRMTADDQWRAWIDGEPIEPPEHADTWDQEDQLELELESGETHTLAIHALDAHEGVSMLIAKLETEDGKLTHTGDGQWRVLPIEPPSGWQLVDFDDSDWNLPEICDDPVWWGLGGLMSTGAQFIWARDCRELGQSWFRFTFDLD